MMPSPETLATLWQRFHLHQDLQAREQLILAHRHFVFITARWISLRYRNPLSYSDMVGAGYLGLVVAVDKFDPGKGTQFSTYAILKIRGAIFEELRTYDWTPRSEREKMKAAKDQKIEWRHKGYFPTDEERKAVEIVVNHQVSLEQTLFPGSQLRQVDVMIDPSPDPPSLTQEADRDTRLLDLVRRLPEREAEVVYRYYYEGETYKAIGAALCISESRAYQLQQAAMVRFKRWMDEEGAW